MKRVAYHNLGCKVNYYELEAVKEIMQEDGYVTVDFETQADVYIINTCSVTNTADQKSRQMINRARQHGGEAAVVVAMGCFAQELEEGNATDINADIIIGNNRKHNIINDIAQFVRDRRKITDVTDINDSNICYEDLLLDNMSDHTRAFIKIQDGCNEFCSYCIIPYLRGRIRSRAVPDILKEISELTKVGVREVVLTGIHISSYCDEDTYHLIDLIEAINKLEGVKRIRLGSLEPRIITKEFVERLVNVDKICPHFHLSLQSGSDSVLKRMNRKYTTDEFYQSLILLREYFDMPAITTDVIVGFPGETDEEFEETYNFLKKCSFYEMHVFKYSRRHGTRADKMTDQIDESIKKERSNRLLSLNHKISDEFRALHINREVEVLFEEPVIIDGITHFTGYTREYIKAMMIPEEGEDLNNKIIRCRGIILKNNALLVEKIT